MELEQLSELSGQEKLLIIAIMVVGIAGFTGTFMLASTRFPVGKMELVGLIFQLVTIESLLVIVAYLIKIEEKL